MPVYQNPRCPVCGHYKTNPVTPTSQEETVKAPILQCGQCGARFPESGAMAG